MLCRVYDSFKIHYMIMGKAIIHVRSAGSVLLIIHYKIMSLGPELR